MENTKAKDDKVDNEFLEDLFENEEQKDKVIDAMEARAEDTLEEHEVCRCRVKMEDTVFTEASDDFEYKEIEKNGVKTRIPIIKGKAQKGMNIYPRRLPLHSSGKHDIYRTPLERRMPAFVLRTISRLPIIGRLYKLWFESYRKEQIVADVYSLYGQTPPRDKRHIV